MNIMTGYLSATEGEVLVDGHSMAEEPNAAKACIGYLPELPPLLYGDNVFEKHGINRDRTGDGEKPRCLCGKRGIFNRDGAANYQTT